MGAGRLHGPHSRVASTSPVAVHLMPSLLLLLLILRDGADRFAVHRRGIGRASGKASSANFFRPALDVFDTHEGIGWSSAGGSAELWRVARGALGGSGADGGPLHRAGLGVRARQGVGILSRRHTNTETKSNCRAPVDSVSIQQKN